MKFIAINSRLPARSRLGKGAAFGAARMGFGKRYIVIVNLCLLAIIAYEGSSLLKSFFVRRIEVPQVRLVDPPPIRPAEPAAPVDYGAIQARDIFHPAPAEVPAVAVPPRSSVLQVRLLGIALRSNGDSTCVIEDLGGKQQSLYKIGDEVQDDAKVARIEWRRVVLTRDGDEEVLELAPQSDLPEQLRPKGGDVAFARLPAGHLQPIGENQFRVDRAEFEQVLQVAMAQFPEQVQAEPYYENDRRIGFRIASIKPGGLFSQVGLQSGDIIRRINSADFGDPEGGGRFPDIRTVAELTVSIVRGGTERTLRYQFR